MEKKFVIATNNPHKVIEFKRILEPMGIACVSLKEMGIICDAEETGVTFGVFLRWPMIAEFVWMP